jgi:hypothetical protein
MGKDYRILPIFQDFWKLKSGFLGKLPEFCHPVTSLYALAISMKALFIILSPHDALQKAKHSIYHEQVIPEIKRHDPPSPYNKIHGSQEPALSSCEP